MSRAKESAGARFDGTVTFGATANALETAATEDAIRNSLLAIVAGVLLQLVRHAILIRAELNAMRSAASRRRRPD